MQFHIYLQIFRETKVEGFDKSKYQTVQVFYPSKDGTNIPMFIVHKKVSTGIMSVFLPNYLLEFRSLDRSNIIDVIL